ncbi:MAG: porin [Vicingus serpentipes]|nr:porin [Vicingus serpentipes]
MKKINLLLTILFLVSYSYSQDTTNNTFGKGLYNVVAKDNSYSMKFAIRVQSLFVGDWNIHEDDGISSGRSQFLIRRARLKFGGFAYNPKLVYKVELGLTNRDLSGTSPHTSGAPRMILDAVIKWNFYKNLFLWVGQTKLPGNRERVISSANLQFVDRSKLNSKFNIDRDMGAQLHHHFKLGENFVIQEMFCVSQGEGRNVTENNLGGYQYTGRIEVLPFGKFASKGDYVGSAIKREEKPKLALGGTYDMNDRAVKTRSNQGSYMTNDVGYFETDIITVFGDMMFKYKGISVMGEYAVRTAEKDGALNVDGTKTGDVVGVGTGMNFQAGYMFNNKWEVAGRYTLTDWDDVVGKEDQTQYTLGVSKFFAGHNLKAQSDVTYSTEENNPNSDLMFRLQLDIHL